MSMMHWKFRESKAPGMGRLRVCLVITGLACALASVTLVANSRAPGIAAFIDGSGLVETRNATGGIDIAGPFFQSLGSNNRTCATCHQPGDGWTVTPGHIQARFQSTQGKDPIFRPVDGADCPSADVSTVQARQSAYSMLLQKGLIRVSLPVPETADFSVIGVNDPHNCPETTPYQLALFRRPLPATNLSFLTTVMWDGRESFPGNTLVENIRHQALDATLGHAQATQTPTDAQLQGIVDFEIANFTAQSFASSGGNLSTRGGNGGPAALTTQKFYVGINDPLGGDPTGAAFNSNVFNIYDEWGSGTWGGADAATEARKSIARGQKLFNTMPIEISGVAGLNDKPGVPASFTGTCTTCHNTPNVGDHSVALPINIGVADYPALGPLDTTGLPVYTIQCRDGKTVTSTDPARALITGKCADIGKTKGPILRGLAARAPYFHNGSAATLGDVVEFYKMRFGFELTDQQKKDLVAFLSAL